MSNTMLALARLGGASKQRFGMGRMQAAFAAIAGSDPLGRFFLAQLQQAGLTLLATPSPDTNTGLSGMDVDITVRYFMHLSCAVLPFPRTLLTSPESEQRASLKRRATQS